MRTEPGVLGVSGWVEHRERVGSAVQEDGDEHRVGRDAARAIPSSKRPSGSLLAPYTESASPAVRVRKVRRLRPLPAGSGIPASMLRQAASGLGHRAAENSRAGELVAGTAHVSRSGSRGRRRRGMRRAFRTEAPGCRAVFGPASAAPPPERARGKPRRAVRVVVASVVGSPQDVARPERSSCVSTSVESFPLAVPRSIARYYRADDLIQRPRKRANCVEPPSCSQPATFVGRRGAGRRSREYQAQAPVSTGRRAALSACRRPCRGSATLPSRPGVESGCTSIASTTGRDLVVPERGRAPSSARSVVADGAFGKEVAPQPSDEVGQVRRVLQAELAGVVPVEVPALAEDVFPRGRGVWSRRGS